MNVRKFFEWALKPFTASREQKYIKRLKFAREQIIVNPEEAPKGFTRDITLDVIVWLIRFYEKHPDAIAEGTPEIVLNKTLRVPKSLFGNSERIKAKVLSHWIQYKHIDGY